MPNTAGACRASHACHATSAPERGMGAHIAYSLEAIDVEASVLAPERVVGAVQEAAAPRGGVVRHCLHKFAGGGGRDIKDDDRA